MPGDELVDAGTVNSEECAPSHLLPHGRRFLGKGIAEADLTDARSLGLLGMQERALQLGGTVMVKAGESRGTVVTLRAPCRLVLKEQSKRNENNEGADCR